MKKMIYLTMGINNPPLTGVDVHTREMLKVLKDLGYSLFLFIIEMEQRPLHHAIDPMYDHLEVFQFRGNRVALKERFETFLDKIDPDFIFMNYITWDDILDHSKYENIPRIIHNHHFTSSRNKISKYFNTLWNTFQPTSLEEVPQKLYDLNFIKQGSFEPDLKEYEVYDRYDLTIAMQDYGAKLIEKHCLKTKVTTLPVILSHKDCSPTYQQVAVLPLSPYNFNYQGYIFFAKCVLPLILKQAPLFRIRILGLGSNLCFPCQNVIIRPPVLDIGREYRVARMSLCPAFVGTGQQIKIIEAMHYAIPVVCMHNSMQYNPIVHKETGFIAHSPEEFADYALELYQNPQLAKSMGEKAQKQAREKYSTKLLYNCLSQIENI